MLSLKILRAGILFPRHVGSWVFKLKLGQFRLGKTLTGWWKVRVRFEFGTKSSREKKLLCSQFRKKEIGDEAESCYATNVN